jgi:hypothetical protein
MTERFDCHHCGDDTGPAYWSDERSELAAANFGLVLHEGCYTITRALSDADYAAAAEAYSQRLDRAHAERHLPTAENVADAIQGAIEPYLFARYLREDGDAHPCSISAHGPRVLLTVCGAQYEITVMRLAEAPPIERLEEALAGSGGFMMHESDAMALQRQRLRELAFSQCVQMAVMGIRMDLKNRGHQVATDEQVLRAARVQAQTDDPAVLTPLVAAIKAALLEGQ